ncbi:hypothetical protein APHAL10511_001696 [Amanita phalloides]|nr:hypothetical protein APHAL10511_001696 [Amanita phalloides]
MLGARTKQINAYGKRSQRIVSVSDERPARKEIPNVFDEPDVPAVQWGSVVSRMRKRENMSKFGSPKSSSPPSPQVIYIKRRKLLMSPLRRRQTSGSQDAVSVGIEAGDSKAGQKKDVRTKSAHINEVAKTLRTPLAAHVLNIPPSPAITKRHKHAPPKAPKKLHQPTLDVIDVKITVLDDDGTTIATERREVRHAHRTKSQDKFGLPDSDDEPLVQPRRLQKAASRRRVYSDESESDDVQFSRPSSRPPSSQQDHVNAQPGPVQQIQHLKSKGRVDDSIARPSVPESGDHLVPFQHRPRQYPPSQPYSTRIPSPIARPRQLTPIHGLRNSRSIIALPSPPTPSDFDSSLELSDIEFGSSPFLHSSPYLSAPPVPDYLKPLLQECHQEDCGLHEFSAFIKSFPYDPIVRSSEIDDEGGNHSFKKIGEASYSEVFGIGDVVLKIIPLRNESPSPNRHGNNNFKIEGPATSDAKDVRKEIIVTRTMGECEVDTQSYSYNFGMNTTKQKDLKVSGPVYAIIVLPNGGPDLEAYTFTNPGKSGWRQACSVFWQVTKALAHAEQLVSFEHRDLHWGQILVKDLSASVSQALESLSLDPDRPFMDDPIHGIQATIIDLGLSRMDAADTNGCEKVYWTAIDEEVFMGEGDYQFDVYRIMREHVGAEWEIFDPLTNVMWLHYLVLKLLNSKRLKVPSSRARRVTTATFTKMDYYHSLLEMEKLLAKCVAQVRPRKKARGRKALPEPIASEFSCAGDVVQYGVMKGWIMPVA